MYSFQRETQVRETFILQVKQDNQETIRTKIESTTTEKLQILSMLHQQRGIWCRNQLESLSGSMLNTHIIKKILVQMKLIYLSESME